jgi:Proprotein convertase P-domain
LYIFLSSPICLFSNVTGIVDAAAAVEAASNWVNFEPQTMLSATSGRVNIPYDDKGTTITSDVTIEGIMTVESVVVYLEIESSTRGELDIRLKSPQGTESILTPGLRPENTQLPANQRWKLMTVRSWGESSAGNWTLSITDSKPGDLSDCVDLDILCKSLEIFLSGSGATCEVASLVDPTVAKVAPSCCYCGGGKDASSIQNQLVSWTLVVYGHDMTGLLEPTVSPAPSFYPETSTPTWSDSEPTPPNAAP